MTPTFGEAKSTEVGYDGLTATPISEVDWGFDAKPARDYTLDAAGAPKAITAAAGGDYTPPDTPDPDAGMVPGESQFLTTDGHGNVTTVTDDGGDVACTTRYDPFGAPATDDEPDSGGGEASAYAAASTAEDPDKVCQTGDTLSSRFYRSGRRDAATGTYQLGSRTYDPARAGFHTPDSYRNAPATADLSIGTDPLTDNRYSYVNGDPVNLVDPDGHAPTEGDGRSGPAPGYPGGGPTGGGSSSSGGTTAGTNSDNASSSSSGGTTAGTSSDNYYADNSPPPSSSTPDTANHTPPTVHQGVGWSDVPGVAKGVGEAMWDTVTGLPALAQAGIEVGRFAIEDPSGAWALHRFGMDYARNNPREVGAAIMNDFAAPVRDDYHAGNQGEAFGRVAFDVALAVATAGTASAASSGARAGSAVGRIAGRVGNIGAKLRHATQQLRAIDLADETGAIRLGGRGQGRLRPDPNATGPHSTFRRDPASGHINRYETYTPQTNPFNPNPWQSILRYDATGRAHYNKATEGSVPAPHVSDPNTPGGIRPAHEWEQPR